MIRNDYDDIFDRLGPDGLTAALIKRLGHTPLLDREMRRMAQTGKWLVAWDDETGDARITGRQTAEQAR